MRFSGEVVLVTGSSRGLGRAFARVLAQEGATVAVNSTGRSDVGEVLADEINGAHFATDVRDAEALVDRVAERFGRLDAVVHNAGIVSDKTLRKMEDEQWAEVIDVHLTSAFELSRAAWPHFERAGSGRLVFISSASGLYGNFGQSNYAAAKAGMYGLCRTIALEGASANIRANCVAPFGATEMNSATLPDGIKDIIRPEYIAPLVAYLCHPECNESGGLFEASAGVFKQLRWERSAGLRLTPEDTIDLATLAARWEEVGDFSQTEHPAHMGESLSGMYQGQTKR